MNASQMIDLMHCKPFTAFEIHLSDGAHIRVEQPFQISPSPLSVGC
jgi:hypothetical protein